MSKVLTIIARRILSARHRFWDTLNRISVADRCKLADGAQLLGDARIENSSGSAGSIEIGASTVVLGTLCVFCEGARIKLGEMSYVGPGSNVMAMESIQIGSRVQISHDVNIYDNNSHSLSASARFEHMRTILKQGHPAKVVDVEMATIEICDDAWIGFGSTILKGVRIGRGAIVGAGTMVTKSVPDYSIVVGNPQRVIGASRP
jgi:acetyltransferase-like isoleucine patch superfamily enzyme